ncbi:Outer membrane protein assembly factor BamB [Flavobacterium bizetiae]|uniref:Outer membrane protein assembly factor BamB n=1 Tax=Flavobacterium bizetiae TaxID=2704140 RepID=A0A6J4G9P3_9FLAO|nr:PQQ-binding-like beta-propeller repeat protein [Flavobacterium bizetiae]CAA9195901.1 Outer membrane protein assembly factor BamB [Flavobacterium bizetiae]CAD5343072.1 Outer membrane protein assembly factor BamB [Flavobacterium bizetiae]CAD5346398.1 Outer membrane protein assembly factor BamB [Flavobacterium bizetiae]
MKKNLVTLLFVCTAINMFGQAPSNSKSGKNSYSNNKVLTANDIVTNKAINPLKKVALDPQSILIYDYDGSLMSFNLESEAFNWTVKATDSHTEMCANQLTLQDGVVYVPFINGEIFAINNKTGQIFWKSRLGTITDQIVLKNQAPIINDGKLFITTQSPNNNIYALDIKDGSLIWNYKLEGSNNDIPVLFFDNKVFTQSGNNFYSFEANTGKLLSQKTFEEPIHGKAVTDGENVFVANEKNVVFALNPNTLDIVWQFKLDENQSNIKDRIFSKDKKLYFAAEGPEVSSLYAVDSKTGTQIWKTDFKNDIIEYVVEESDNAWGYTRKGKLFQIDLANGEMAFDMKLSTRPISNLEFAEENYMYYYSDAALIQFEFSTKDENEVYLRTSIKDDAYSAYLKILR